MATMTPESHTARRLVLIDFDWQEADLMPELLARSGVSVRLVASENREDVGVRLAEMCDLPHTVDLADLTREIFDVALVGERSPRRTQLEGLLLALGTPCMTPQRFLEGAEPDIEPPAIEAPLALHAAALETSLAGGALDAVLERALPELGDPTPLETREPQPTGALEVRVDSLSDFPSSEVRTRLENALASLAQQTGAAAAEIHVGRREGVERVVGVGGADPLMRGLVGLALAQGTPQVVSPITGPNVGKAWGAWPFRTTRSRGVLAAAAIDPAEGWNRWEGLVDELRKQWDQADREQAGPSFPVLPDEPEGWLECDDFLGRVELAIERHRHDGMPFTLYRLDGPAGDAFDAFCARLATQLRATDRLHRAAPGTALVLTVTAPVAFAAVRRRIAALWRECAVAAGIAEPPAFGEKHQVLTMAAQSAAFRTAARRWLGMPDGDDAAQA